MSDRTTANIFMHGRSQAVRLPKEFRFEEKKFANSAVGQAFCLSR